MTDHTNKLDTVAQALLALAYLQIPSDDPDHLVHVPGAPPSRAARLERHVADVLAEPGPRAIALLDGLYDDARAALLATIDQARPLPPLRARLAAVDRVADAYDAAADTIPASDHAWALVQYNGGRAPDEKWLTTHTTLAAAGAYAAADDEWRPELLVDLRTGHAYHTTSRVGPGARLGDFGPVEAPERLALTSLPPGSTYRTAPDGPLLEVLRHGPEKTYVRLHGATDQHGSSVNTNIDPQHPSIHVLVDEVAE